MGFQTSKPRTLQLYFNYLSLVKGEVFPFATNPNDVVTAIDRAYPDGLARLIQKNLDTLATAESIVTKYPKIHTKIIREVLNG
jgi:hypothetical protein